MIKPKYNFAALSVGQRVFLPNEDRSKVYQAAHRWSVRKKQYFVVKQRDGGVEVTRVDESPYAKKTRKNPYREVERELVTMRDSIRFLSIMVIRMDQKLNELIEEAGLVDPQRSHREEAQLKDFAIHRGGMRS